MGRKRESWQRRFWKYVERGGPNECWEWKGSRCWAGYGLLNARDAEGTDHQERAHRLSWRLHCDPIPAGLCVCHHCDNPGCVNPAHLFLGTRTDNAADRDAKGRAAWQRRVLPRTPKLSASKVLAIRAAKHTGTPAIVLAERFGVTEGTIYKVARRDTWRHVEESCNA